MENLYSTSLKNLTEALPLQLLYIDLMYINVYVYRAYV